MRPSGRASFCKLDVLHRRNLERFMPRFGLRDLSDDVLHELTLVWHRLDAWPEVPAAIKRLKKRRDFHAHLLVYDNLSHIPDELSDEDVLLLDVGQGR